MGKHRDALIIHTFALLHAGVALGCRLLGLTDDIVLTLLTMLMVIIICLRKGMNEKFMALSIILANILGFVIAYCISFLLGIFISSPLVINPIATFITTELLGFTTLLMASSTGRKEGFTNKSRENLRWLLLAIVIIICVRLAILLLFSDDMNSQNMVVSIIVDYIFSCAILIFLAEYAIRINTKAQEDREKARLAQYRYLNLSQQVNPHFLFNSLNILDCMVCEQKNEQASSYIHKLAGIYRYFLQNEEERLVTLREEMSFVGKYIDLLMIRFPEGLDIETDVPEDRMGRKVVPCSVQLLIENATKHNAVDASMPLRIRVFCRDDCVIVSNNLNPRISGGTSTGLGLKYLREQCLDVTGRETVVTQNENEYKVEIPLI